MNGTELSATFLEASLPRLLPRETPPVTPAIFLERAARHLEPSQIATLSKALSGDRTPPVHPLLRAFDAAAEARLLRFSSVRKARFDRFRLALRENAEPPLSETFIENDNGSPLKRELSLSEELFRHFAPSNEHPAFDRLLRYALRLNLLWRFENLREREGRDRFTAYATALTTVSEQKAIHTP